MSSPNPATARLTRPARPPQTRYPQRSGDEAPALAAPRPPTAEGTGKSGTGRRDADGRPVAKAPPPPRARVSPPLPPPAAAPRGRILRLEILSTWGDEHYVGLSGVQVLSADGRALPLPPGALSAQPRDLQSVPGFGSDPRQLANLLLPPAVTVDPAHMWLAPFQARRRLVHRVSLFRGFRTLLQHA